MRELNDQPQWRCGTVNFHLQQGCVFYYRDIKSTIRYVLRQRTFAEHMIYEPVREFDAEGNRVYTDMHTGDWWWQTQVCYRPVVSDKLAKASLYPLDDSPSWFYAYSTLANIGSNKPH